MKKRDYIELIFKNWDRVNIPIKDIWSFDRTHIKKSTNTGEEILTAEEMHLVARSRANKKENLFLTSESKIKYKDILPFDRIKEGNDLYVIHEHFSDGSSVFTYVWDGEGTHNPLQTTYINQEIGELFLVISKENNAYDYFKSCVFTRNLR